MYKKTKQIAFKLEGRDLEELTLGGARHGLSPQAYAKILVIENLYRLSEKEITAHFNVLEGQIEDAQRKLISVVKEVFHVVADISMEKLDELEAKVESEFSSKPN